MTTMTIQSADTDTDLGNAEKVQSFLDEALAGPVGSGAAGTIRVQDIKLDVCASRDWGVRFSRTLPGGRVESRHLSGADVTLDGAGKAVAELLTVTV